MSFPIVNSSGENVPMTVSELILALQQMPQDAVVVTEGCDCDGKVEQVQVWGTDVHLKRSQIPY